MRKGHHSIAYLTSHFNRPKHGFTQDLLIIELIIDYFV